MTAWPAADVPRETELVAGAYFAELPVKQIVPNTRQPREYFDDEDLKDLGESIKEVGLLQPIVVRKIGEERYELIMGERRWRASQVAGLTEIPAIVRQTEDNRMLLDALLENLQRAQLNALEEAAAFDQLLKDFECTHGELAVRVSRSRSYISNSLRLLKMAALGAAENRRGHHLGRTRQGAGRSGRPRRAGEARPAHHRRTALGAHGRGARPDARPGEVEEAAQAASRQPHLPRA